MPTSPFLRLPVNADEGFPQSFLLAMLGNTYRFELYVNVAEHELPPFGSGVDPRTTLDLVGGSRPAPSPTPPTGHLVLVVVRQEADGDVPLLRRRVLPGLVYPARDLLITFFEITVALGNLNGVGAYGSRIAAGVAAR